MTVQTRINGVATSADGTPIAYTIQGSGPALLLMNCVSCDRVSTPQPTLADELAANFTVISYDRRGNGASPSTLPYALEREFEDITALTALVDGPVDAYGFSSGAVLALLAAGAGAPIRRLALLEPPLITEDWPDERERIATLMPTDPAAARQIYLTEIVGVPPEVLATIPATDRDLANAPTMLHELEFLPGADASAFAGLANPTLLIRSDHTVPEMAMWAEQLVAVMPNARAVAVPGQWHGVDDATLADVLVGFLATEE
ncbi:alpha/beta fold hydrolase [Microbacterium gorillae]|uniref:alpha/beta fold hydrolase n=1 Tax=Microbacterium gorillae TaxID=1231063 RepID=UPI000693E805|nr:alpha/beta hydrolase [Microbacterium gorillae]